MAKKKVQDQGAQIPRNAAYLAVREIPRNAAQHRYWTFYEAINIENSICIKMIFTGFYPRIHDQGIAPEQWLNSYYLTHLERDVRNILKVGDLEAFGRFIRLCAGRNGQLQIPIEIKSAKTVASDFFDNIHYWLNLSGHPEAFALLIYGGNQHTNRRGVRVLPWFFI